jgi:hypothetical protein
MLSLLKNNFENVVTYYVINSNSISNLPYINIDSV